MSANRLSLDGRTALVTGASGGLGRHFALTLARAGARVAVTARRVDALEKTAEDIRADGGTAFATAMDVTDAASVAAAFSAIADELGPVTILVNNAGVASSARFLDTEEADWRHALDVNLDGSWRVAREAARRMAEAGTGGSIINIASILGLIVSAEVSAYAVSKAAVVQLTKAMALELAAHDIRVNALAPGYFVTDLNRNFLASEPGQRLIAKVPQRRTGDLVDLEGPLLLLASDAGAFMTGAIVPVDGGALLTF